MKFFAQIPITRCAPISFQRDFNDLSIKYRIDKERCPSKSDSRYGKIILRVRYSAYQEKDTLQSEAELLLIP